MPPSPAKSNRTLIIVVVVVIILAVVGLVAAAVLVKGPPNMHITNFQLGDQRSCDYFGSGSGYVIVTLDLVNTGGNGFAAVAYTLDGVTDRTNNYYVTSGSTLSVHDSVFVSDCNAHTVAAQITREWAS